ncbi:MAG: MFS transporter [Jatrophihabitantaceae bacterium]
MPTIQVSQSLLRVPAFRNLWLAQTLSQLGTQVTVLAIPLVGLLLEASASQIGLLYTAEFAPILVLGLPVGALLDRLPLRPVMLVADAARALALAVIPIAHVMGMLTLPLLYVVACVIGLGTLFFDVAQLSYLPALIRQDQLGEGNAKLEGSRSLAQLGGPTVGGLLIQVMTAPVALLLDGLSYLASFTLLLFVRADRETQTQPKLEGGMRQEIAEGIRYVLRHPVLRPLAMCDASANLGFAAILALQVLYAARTLGLNPASIGLVLAAGNAGGLAGALLCGRLTTRFAAGPLMICSLALAALGAAVLPLSHSAISFGAGLFLAYAGAVIYNIVQITLRQLVTPERLLNRANATLRFIEWGTLPLGAAVGGMLVAPLGLRGVLAAAAAVCALSMIPALFSAEVRSAGRLAEGPVSVPRRWRELADECRAGVPDPELRIRHADLGGAADLTSAEPRS